MSKGIDNGGFSVYSNAEMKEVIEKVIVGVVSYFPDNEYRAERIRRCRRLVADCERLFGVPIVVIAQNWEGEDVRAETLVRMEYPKLGITKARKRLWEYFRASGHEWMICFDDDCSLVGDEADGRCFVEELKKHKGGYVLGKKNEFKLCAFHRSVAERYDIPDVDVDEGTGIEDYAFFRLLEEHYPDGELAVDKGTLAETSSWKDDEATTWNRSNLQTAKLLQKTAVYIKKYGKSAEYS